MVNLFSKLSEKTQLIILFQLNFLFTIFILTISLIIIRSQSIEYRNENLNILFSNKKVARELTNDSEYAINQLLEKIIFLEYSLNNSMENSDKQINSLKTEIKNLKANAKEVSKKNQEINKLVETTIIQGETE
ncbi:MAG: hypothetical protein R3321_02270 [Nitrososphaeraceae archaeon]|nr:hypothetical protein [Nitrososphaeraceae archaeon]